MAILHALRHRRRMPTAHPGLFTGASPAGRDAFEDDPVGAAPGLEVDGLAERPSFLLGVHS